MARDGGCCETTPFSGSAVLDDVKSIVQLLLPFPLLQSLEKLAKGIHLELRSWGALTVSC